MTPTTLGFLVFLAVALVVCAIAMVGTDIIGGRRRLIARRLAISAPVDISDLPPQLAPSTQPALPTAKLTRHIDDWFERLVNESGLPLRSETAFLLAVACGLLTGGVLFLWRNDLLVGVAGALAGMLIVIAVFPVVRSRQRRKIREQLPDAISLLSRGVQAGESLEQALALVGDHVKRPLADEFQYCCWHLGMGLSVEATMRALTRRVPIVEVQILASTLVVQRRTGGDLPEALESLSRVIRDRINYYRQFRAITAASRLSAIVIAVSGPILAIVVWSLQPKEFTKEFLNSPQGQNLLILAACLYAAGLTAIFRMLRPHY